MKNTSKAIAIVLTALVSGFPQHAHACTENKMFGGSTGGWNGEDCNETYNQIGQVSGCRGGKTKVDTSAYVTCQSGAPTGLTTCSPNTTTQNITTTQMFCVLNAAGTACVESISPAVVTPISVNSSVASGDICPPTPPTPPDE